MDSSTSKQEVREYLERLFPDLNLWLEDEPLFGSMNQGSAEFTFCGLFMELICYLDNRTDQLNANDLESLGVFCESAFLNIDRNRRVDSDDFLGAVEICFLESIAGYKKLADALRPYLGPRSRYALDLDIR